MHLAPVKPRLASDWFDTMFGPLDKMLSPFKKTNDGFIGKFDVPGFGEGDIDISVEDRVMTLSGKIEDREVDYSFVVPEAADVGLGEATIKNGVLTITLPIAEASKSRKIEVKTSS